MINNGGFHVVSTIIHNAMSSAANKNIAYLYINAKYGDIIRNMLE